VLWVVKMTYDVVLFIFHGFLGGLLWLLIYWRWNKRAVVQHTIVSAIAGYLYWLLHSEYNFPNAIMTIVVGYFSVDFVKQIMRFFAKKNT